MTMLSQSRKLRQAGNEEGAIFSAQEEKTQAKGGIHTAAHIHVCTNAINMNPICISPSLRCPFPLSITITPFVIDPIEQPQKPKLLLLLRRHNPLAADGGRYI